MVNENTELLKNFSSLLSLEIPDKHLDTNSSVSLTLEDLDTILTILFNSQNDRVIKLANLIITLIKGSNDDTNIPILEIKRIESV